jgi:hypothetical protein
MDNEKLIEEMARAYCTTAMRQGFHVDQSVCAERMEAALAAHNAALEAAGFMVVQGWRDIADAPRDRTHILVKVRDDAFAGTHFAHYSGRCFVAFHEGVTSGGGYDLGWALFPGFGGVGDSDLEGWMPLLAAAPNAGRG